MAAITGINVKGIDTAGNLDESEVQATRLSSASAKKSMSAWPYAQGFLVDHEERIPIELEVAGTIPAYAAGTLYRTGPSNYKLRTNKGDLFKASHWFDGFNQVHRFEIKEVDNEVKVFYNSRRTVDELIQHIKETGDFKDFSFAQKRDPCQSLFKKVMSTFKTAAANSANGSIPTAQNVGVTISANVPGLDSPEKLGLHGTRIQTLTTKTDAKLYQRLDPETLEPQGVCQQSDLHSDLKGPLSAAHAKTCPITGDFFNFNLDFTTRALYRVFRTSATTGETTILATISGIGAYLHSLFLTTSTVIICVWNSHFSNRGLSLLLNRNILDSIAPLDPKQPATWYVVDRSPAKRGLLATYTSPAFFAFHTVNAFEQASTSSAGDIDILAEVSTYTDLSILHRFYYENLLPQKPDALSYSSDHKCKSHLTRYRLSSVPLLADDKGVIAPTYPRPAEILFTSPSDISPELPTINPRYTTREHRYTYGISDTGRSLFFDGLVKLDTKTGKGVHWSEFGHTAGEPIFVTPPKEDGRELDEDEGILLSVVLDGLKGTSYLLCLDARTMKETGRAVLKSVVGFGFHGLHVPISRTEVYFGGD